MHSFEGRNLGAYRLIEQVGIGGMAVVYKAYDPSLDRYVAIKLLPEYLVHDQEFSTRFRNEARNVARLSHPNILPIYGYGEEDGLSYFVMALVEGGTLKDLMGAPMDPVTAVTLLGQIADALNYAHEQGIVHRDVKPANVLMSRPDWPLLSDFGIARVLEQQTMLTRSAFLGTPHYMAPEQARGEPVSPKTDQYALGIVLYEMLTGSPPFHADTPQAIVYQHIYASLPLPRERNPIISEAMEGVILKALAKDPGDRFPDMTSFAAAAREALAETSNASTSTPSTLPLPVVRGGDPVPLEQATDSSPLTRANGPGTERIEKLSIVPVVQTVESAEPTEQMKREGWWPFPFSRRIGAGIAAIAALAVAAVVFAVIRSSGSASQKPDSVLTVTATGGNMPGLTVTAKNGTLLANAAADAVRQGAALPHGNYLVGFESGSGYNGQLPVTLTSGKNTVDLSRRMAFVRIRPAPGTSVQSVEVDSTSGQYLFDLPVDVVQQHQGVPPGKYLMTIKSDSGYLDPLPAAVRAGSRQTFNLARLYGHLRIVPPANGSLPQFDMKDAGTGQWLHGVSSLEAERGLYVRPGRYSLEPSSSTNYLDPMIVTARAGASTTLTPDHAYGFLHVVPFPHAAPAAFDLEDALTHATLHYNMGAALLRQGVHLKPGRYLLVPDARTYLANLPVTIRSHSRTDLRLADLYGGFKVIPAPDAPISSFDIRKASQVRTLFSVYQPEAGQLLLIPPGPYTLDLSTGSDRYPDPLEVGIQAGIVRDLDISTMDAGVHFPAAPSDTSLSYQWTSHADKAVKTADAQSKAEVQYMTPGTYRFEVTRGSASRIIVVHAVAGNVAQLPDH